MGFSGKLLVMNAIISPHNSRWSFFLLFFVLGMKWLLLLAVVVGVVVGEPRPPLTGTPPEPELLAVVECYATVAPTFFLLFLFYLSFLPN